MRRKHFMYGAWAGMINRCYNPNNSSYARYGGVGIYVCDRWRSDFLNFLEDMGDRPDGKTLDRIDPTGPYTAENCRWATLKEQRANMSQECRERTNAAISAAKKRYWNEWRTNAEMQSQWREKRGLKGDNGDWRKGYRAGFQAAIKVVEEICRDHAAPMDGETLAAECSRRFAQVAIAEIPVGKSRTHGV